MSDEDSPCPRYCMTEIGVSLNSNVSFQSLLNVSTLIDF